MNNSLTIGILGGMGPHAGLDLADKITAETVATSDQDHASVVLLSYPDRIPDRSTWLADTSKPDPVPVLVDMVRQLARLGVNVAGMPCVTAHNTRILGRMNTILEAEACPTRVVSMIDSTARFIKDNYPDLKRIGAISTTATFEARLFFSALENEGLNIVRQTDSVQELVQQSIFNSEFGIKAVSHPVHPHARANLVEAVAHLKEHGAQAVILGCTELPLGLPDKEIHGVRLIDPTLVLARELLRLARPEKIRAFNPA